MLELSVVLVILINLVLWGGMVTIFFIGQINPDKAKNLFDSLSGERSYVEEEKKLFTDYLERDD